MRLVADALKKQQRGIVRRQRDRIDAIARVEELFLFRDADPDEIGEAELLERRVSGRQLPLAAVDQHEIGKRSALLEELAIAAQHDFVHGGKVVVGGWGLGATSWQDIVLP